MQPDLFTQPATIEIECVYPALAKVISDHKANGWQALGMTVLKAKGGYRVVFGRISVPTETGDESRKSLTSRYLDTPSKKTTPHLSVLGDRSRPV